jgi:hypothetical protein
MGEDRKVHKILVGKPEGKRPLGRPRRRWEDANNTTFIPRVTEFGKLVQYLLRTH